MKISDLSSSENKIKLDQNANIYDETVRLLAFRKENKLFDNPFKKELQIHKFGNIFPMIVADVFFYES